MHGRIIPGETVLSDVEVSLPGTKNTNDNGDSAWENGSTIADLWYIAPRPATSHGWPVYSREFILLALQGKLTEPHRLSRTVAWLTLATVVQALMVIAQAILMLLAFIPITSCFLETMSRVSSRNTAGFFLRACYWKAKLKHLGQDTFIDQNVEIWGAASVSIGSHCHIDTNVRLAAGERQHSQHGWISVGDYVHLGPGVHIAGRGGVRIGSFVGIMANAHIYSATGVIEHPDDPGQLICMTHTVPHDQQYVVESPIWVEDYALIGMMTRIMPGVRIGRAAIVHANVELKRNVQPFANIGAIPQGRQIGWRKPRRTSPKWVEPTRKQVCEDTSTTPSPAASQTRIYEITDATDTDAISQVVDLHLGAFPEGVTTQLGRSFVFNYYLAIVRSEDAVLWVAEYAGTIEGFLGCATNRSSFEHEHRSGAARILATWKFFTLRLSPFAINRALRKRRLSRHMQDKAELLSIVVAPTLRRTGLGKRFLSIWADRMRESHLTSYIVFTDNIEGIQFYEKYGGERLFKFKLGTVWSACYRFDVEASEALAGPLTS